MPVAEAVVYSFSKLFLSPVASGPLGFVLPSRSSPGDLCIHPAQQAMGREESQPILGGSELPSSSLYQHARRPYRDTAWGVLYVFSLVLALIGGVYALVHRCVAVGVGATRDGGVHARRLAGCRAHTAHGSSSGCAFHAKQHDRVRRTHQPASWHSEPGLSCQLRLQLIIWATSHQRSMHPRLPNSLHRIPHFHGPLPCPVPPTPHTHTKQEQGLCHPRQR